MKNVQNEEFDNTPINVIHDEALMNTFKKGIGNRVLILTPSFPFLFIGKIEEVVDDIIEVFVETTHFSQLENRSWHIHIDQIEAFYIEHGNLPRIPDLHDMS